MVRTPGGISGSGRRPGDRLGGTAEEGRGIRVRRGAAVMPGVKVSSPASEHYLLLPEIDAESRHATGTYRGARR